MVSGGTGGGFSTCAVSVFTRPLVRAGRESGKPGRRKENGWFARAAHVFAAACAWGGGLALMGQRQPARCLAHEKARWRGRWGHARRAGYPQIFPDLIFFSYCIHIYIEIRWILLLSNRRVCAPMRYVLVACMQQRTCFLRSCCYGRKVKQLQSICAVAQSVRRVILLAI